MSVDWEVTGGNGGAEFRVKFHGGATVAQVQTVLENILYRNTANTPEPQRTIRFTILDGDGGAAFDEIVVYITPTIQPPRNRTDIVMTQLDPGEIRHQFLCGPGWSVDRWPTTSFANTVFDGDTRICVVVDDIGTQSYEGWTYDLGDATQVSVEMYMPSDWGVMGGEALSGL